MFNRIHTITILLAIGCCPLVHAQASRFFIHRGNNISSINCGGIIYAPIVNRYHQSFGAGAAWVRKQADLRLPFTVSFILDFTDTTGVDGGAFVFQTDSNAVGEAFNGFGYRKIDHSIAITFDAVKNDYDHDPVDDHVAIQANGDLDHQSANNLAGPLSIASLYTQTAFPGYPSVFKFHHLVTVNWDPLTINLSVLIDNQPLISLHKNLITELFSGNPMVYWGFTASNTQPVAYDPAAELTFGYMYFFFGDVIPAYASKPTLDTCFVQPVRFIDSSVYSSDYSLQDLQLFKWYWDFGDGTNSSDRNPAPHNYPRPGEYLLKFAATNQLGCTVDTLSRIVRLGSVPHADFTATDLCTNAATRFIDHTRADVGIPVSWNWDLGNGQIGSGNNPATRYADAGTKTVSLSVTTEFGCRGDTTKEIRIDDRPEIQFSYSKNCEQLINYTAVVANQVPVTDWRWNFGDGAVSTVTQPEHHFIRNGSYQSSLVVTGESGCKSDTVRQTVLINHVYAFAGSDTILAAGTSLQLHASGGAIYAWSPPDGLNDPQIANPVATPAHDQTYVLQVKNEDGCVALDTLHIKVYSGPALYIPSAFTPNGDGNNDLFRVTAPGIRELIYFRIFNRWGQAVFETSSMGDGWNGDVAGRPQPAATYVWIIRAIDYKGALIFKKGTVTLLR